MTPMRVVHFADLHLGVETYGRFDPATGLNTRLLDFTARLDEVVDFALEWRADLVLFAGDAYKSRDPSPTQQREFARRIRRLSEAGIACFLLIGNHDLPAATGRANALDIYETLAVPNVTIGRTPDLHVVKTSAGPVQIVGLPWLRRSALLASTEYRSMAPDEARRAIEGLAVESIGKLKERLDPAVPAILAAHVSVDGATYSSERSVLLGDDIVIPRSAVTDPAFAYVALGHIHKHQILNTSPYVIYPGSLERVDFGEEKDPKGFIAAEVEPGAGNGAGPRWTARVEFRQVKARRFVTVRSRPDGVFPTDIVLRDLERAEPEGAIVRLIVEASPEIDANIDYAQIRRALKDAFNVAGIRRDVTQTNRPTGGLLGMEGLGPLEALDAYLRRREVPEARRETLAAYASKLEGIRG